MPQGTATIGFNFGTSEDQEFLSIDFKANKVSIQTQPTTCIYPSDQPFSVQVMLTVTGTSAKALIGVAGTVTNYNLPIYPNSFAAATFYQEPGSLQVPSS